MKKLSLIAAVVLGTLAACSLASAQEGKKDTAKKDGKRGAPNIEQRLDRMTSQLKLTDAQKPKVKDVLEKSAKKMKDLRDLTPEDRRTKGKTLREEQTKELKKILTEEQFKKYEETMQRGRDKKGQGGEKKARKTKD